MKLGKFIGKGKTRTVYEHPTDPKLVIKVLNNPEKKKEKINTNTIEWMLWQKVKNTEESKKLCPCVELTEEMDLIMMKCEPVIERGKSPIKINGTPITDSTKPRNLGLLNGKVVLFDYGNKYTMELLNETW